MRRWVHESGARRESPPASPRWRVQPCLDPPMDHLSFAGTSLAEPIGEEEDSLITESNEKEPTVLSFLMAEAETETAETTEVAAPEEVESPETSTSDQSEETTETEETADGQTEGEDEASTEEATEETESEVEPELPKKQAKTYSKELVDHYAERFGWTPEDVAKDKGDRKSTRLN